MSQQPNKLNEILDALRAGERASALAPRLGMPVPYVLAIARVHGITLKRGASRKLSNHDTTPRLAGRRNPNVIPARAIAMRDEYLSGSTLLQIASKRDLSSERVRQILLRHFGKLSRIGGASYRATQVREAVQRAYDEKCIRVYGLTREQYVAVPRRMREAYAGKVHNCRRLGIHVNMKLADWVWFWNSAGCFDQYGKNKGDVCVDMVDRAKPFEIGNIVVIPAATGRHVRQWNERRVEKARLAHPSPVTIDGTQYSSVKEASIALYGKATAKEIAAAFGATRNQVIGYWFRARNTGVLV